MPSCCHWARSCPEIVIQPWPLSHSSEKQLAYSLPGSSKRRLSTGGHKVLVCDRQKLSVCFPLFSIQIVQLTPHSSGHLPLLAQWEGIKALLCLFLCVMITPRLLGGVKEGYLSKCLKSNCHTLLSLNWKGTTSYKCLFQSFVYRVL